MITNDFKQVAHLLGCKEAKPANNKSGQRNPAPPTSTLMATEALPESSSDLYAYGDISAGTTRGVLA